MLKGNRQRSRRILPRIRSIRCLALPWCAALGLAACAPVAITTQAGYARLSLSGDLALDPDGSGTRVAQDVGSAFGLGSERDCPYARVAVDCGVPEFSASGFWLRESGRGVLSEAFGGLPAGTNVTTDLELGNVKLVAAFGTQLGPVHVAPGLLCDVFLIDFRASSAPGSYEAVDDIVAVPMPCVRVGGSLFGLQADAEIGFLDLLGLRGVDGRFADLEATLTYETPSGLQLLAGYRLVSADAEDENATDAVGTDLRVSGWFVGGGIRF